MEYIYVRVTLTDSINRTIDMYGVRICWELTYSPRPVCFQPLLPGDDPNYEGSRVNPGLELRVKG